MKIVIVGGVAGGATAAARIRRLDENAEIIIFERSGFISYANCGLPYYIGGVIEDEQDLTLQTPESFFRRFKIVAKVNHEVTDIDTKNKTVSVTDLKTGTSFTETYDKLILSPGAKPVLPDFYAENERVFTLRTVEDTLKIRAFIEQKQPQTAVVIGGGFIGLEMAENLMHLGVKTAVVQRSNHLLPTVDCDMASFIHANFRRYGVQLLLNANTEKLTANGEQISLETDNGNKLNADMVVVSIGVTPENTLAKRAGLELGVKGAIKVKAKMETSVPDIYAVGDAVQVKHFITEQDAVISLAGPANKQGRIVADNICGFNSEYQGSQGSSVIKLFDMTVATTGINEQQAKASGIEYEKVILTQNSHAGYYPNATAMTVKLLFEKETYKILGAQIVGYDGVDKRIDVIATAIRAGMKANELKDLDLAYAPPYSSAKDPVNMAGFVADNIKNGVVKQFYYEDIPALRERKDIILLDTRTPFEYMRGCADGFINIPLDDLRERLGELDKTKKIYVMCQSGLRSYLATRILTQNGFDAYNFAGGFRLYSSIEKEELLSKQCYSCGMEKAEMDVIAHYDLLVDENNDPFYDSTELKDYMNKWDGQVFIDALQLDENKEILEIGLGTGRIAVKVAPYCKRLTGIDISPKTIQRAKENLKSYSNISYINGDFISHEFKEKFDVIYSSLTMMHFKNKAYVIDKIDSLLNNDGIFCLSIDKNQSEYIDMGNRKVKIYPDTLDNIKSIIGKTTMLVVNVIETDNSYIIASRKK